MYRTSDERRAAIQRLRADPSLRERLCREGRAAYEAEFSEGAFLTHTSLEVLRTLLLPNCRAPVQTICGDAPAQAGRWPRRFFFTPNAGPTNGANVPEPHPPACRPITILCIIRLDPAVRWFP